MTTKQILSLIPAVQALDLAGENLKVAKQKKKDTKDLLKLGATNIVGIKLIKAEASLIGQV